MSLSFGEDVCNFLNFAEICHLACSFILITRPLQEHACQTQPPPRSNYKDYCNAWIIYDAYENDIENRPKQNKQQDQSGREQETGTGGGSWSTVSQASGVGLGIDTANNAFSIGASIAGGVASNAMMAILLERLPSGGTSLTVTKLSLIYNSLAKP